MTAERPSGLRRIVSALFNSLRGLRLAARSEAAFRQEMALFAVLSLVGGWLADDWRDFLLLEAALVLILIVELLNTAIEKLTDLLHPERHPLAGAVKDMASAAVLLSFLVAAAIWAAVLF